MDTSLDTPAGSSDPFDQEALERDLLVISAYYWDRGYANVRVAEPVIDAATNSIAIAITEGDTFTLGAIAITGTLVGSARTNLAKLRITSGELFSRTRIADDRAALQTYYEDLGYAFADVLPRTAVDLDKRVVALTFEVAPGKIATVERVTVYDAGTAGEPAVRRALGIAAGDRYSTTTFLAGKQRIAQLAHVESVVVSTKRGSTDDQIELMVEITDDSR